MKVLIAYGSRWGSTREIAERLGSFLEEEGIETNLLDLKKSKNWPSLEGYDGVIVGSSVKISKWMREPLVFLKKKSDELKGKQMALFVSCMSMLIEPEDARRDLLEKVADEAEVETELMEAFGPVMDVGSDSRKGFFDKKIAQSVMLGLMKDQGMELDMKGRNDLRDWDSIKKFANRFTESLRK